LNTLKAVILAAGVGQRVGAVAGNKPKCLLEFEGKSLLHRHLDVLRHYGISGIIVVTGYQSEFVEQEISRSDSGIDTRIAHNPDYCGGSLISLVTGLTALGNGQDFLLMDADVLYDHRIIGRLINSVYGNCFLLDRNFEPGDEPVKLCVKDGNLVDFRKKIDKDLQFDFQGESIGFFRFTSETGTRLARQANGYLDRGERDQPYEECIRDLLLQHPEDFAFEDITGLPWIEIDFPDDIARAKHEILPYIRQPDA
jgi:choline kinase